MVFKNLKQQDWIAAGIQGLSSGLTIYAATGLGGGGDNAPKPTPGTQTPYQPIGDMEFLPDGAAPIFGGSTESIDFGSDVMSNIMAGPNQIAQANSTMNMDRLMFDSSILENFDLNKAIPDWGEAFGGPMGDVFQQMADDGMDMNQGVLGMFLKPDNPGTGLLQSILQRAQVGVLNNLIENESIPKNSLTDDGLVTPMSEWPEIGDRVGY